MQSFVKRFAVVARDRRIGRWLVHGADPLRPSMAKLPSPLFTEDLAVLVGQAEAHGVLPAVVRFLGPAGLSLASEDATARLRMLTAHSMMLREHADALIADLRDAPVALVKGLAFARAIYPRPNLRPFTDIDLLVDNKAKPEVAQVLHDHGFEFAYDAHAQERREEKWLHRNNPTLLVEVHTNMVHAPSLQGSLTLSFEDLASIGPDRPAAHMMVAVMHGALHQFERLRQVVDILQAVRVIETADDERQFENLIERTGGRLAAVTGLELAWRLFGERRCRDIARGLSTARSRRLLARLLIDRNVVLSMTTEQRPYYTWRRQGLRELLKRGKV